MLAEAIELARQLVERSNGFEVYAVILRQLEAMSSWTADGRVPTPEERDSIDVGLIAVRELDDDPDYQVGELADRLHELNAFFEDMV